jgi:uncharacterized membrane protein
MFFAYGGTFSKILAVFWGSFILISIVVSLAAPITRAMPYFKVSAIAFSIVNTWAYYGILVQLIKSGPTPAMQIKDPHTNQWNQVYFISKETGGPEKMHNISPLYFVGLIMFAVYFAPMYMRPKDFLFNFSKYLSGFCVWFVMLPCYINIFSIYAFCNLHDISWGNRPAAADTAQMAANAKKQAKLLDNYKVYRINTVAIWLMSNILYVYVVQTLNL